MLIALRLNTMVMEDTQQGVNRHNANINTLTVRRDTVRTCVAMNTNRRALSRTFDALRAALLAQQPIFVPCCLTVPSPKFSLSGYDTQIPIHGNSMCQGRQAAVRWCAETARLKCTNALRALPTGSAFRVSPPHQNDYQNELRGMAEYPDKY